jgi:hypothetical protein
MKTIAAIFVTIVMLASCNIDYQPSRRETALATASAIESAVNNFYAEYGYLPTTLTNDTEINTKDNITDFLNILLGLDSTSGTPLNKRQIKFLTVKEGKNNKNGLIINSAGTAVTGLYDPWGGPYKVMLDADSDAHLKVNGKALDNRLVAVWSDGSDRIAGTKDDIRTW